MSYVCPSCPSPRRTATTTSAMSSRATQATRPFPAGPRITPSGPVKYGTKSAYRLDRRKVYRWPEARMCSSVAWCWRASVNVASGAAARNERYTIRSTPAVSAASTAVKCCSRRSWVSLPETRNSVRAPSSARRIPSASPYEEAATASAPVSAGALARSRTIRRCDAPRSARRAATRPPTSPEAPVMVRSGRRPISPRIPKRAFVQTARSSTR